MDIDSDVIYGVDVEQVGMDVHVKSGNSASLYDRRRHWRMQAVT